ncbi:ABC transporter substrate-binding protein [Streptomyces sp. NPDC056638]|uniref:ABC transporter substrate-binding protein n=1 Tax=Streptomyces sp. NPDC056638 TaxID=3345887 RepID=UPI00368C8F5E
MTTGAADGTYAESPNTAAALQGKKGVEQHYGPSTASLVLIPTERGGLKDPKIRRALSLALDRKGIAASGYGGMVQPWGTPSAPAPGAMRSLSSRPPRRPSPTPPRPRPPRISPQPRPWRRRRAPIPPSR